MDESKVLKIAEELAVAICNTLPEPSFLACDYIFTEVVRKAASEGNSWAKQWTTYNGPGRPHCPDFRNGLRMLKTAGSGYWESPTYRYFRVTLSARRVAENPVTDEAKAVVRAFCVAVGELPPSPSSPPENQDSPKT
jgi:hypothetical protein